MGLVAELSDVLRKIAVDADCRVVILTGAGRRFCSGHALGEIGDMGGLTLEDELLLQEQFSRLIVQLNEMPQVVIAAVNGAAAGGGLALALAADVRLGANSAVFNAAFVKLGTSGCDVGVSYLLPRIVGPTLAFEMMLTGRLIDAAEAQQSGLVLRVVPDDEILPAALELARQVMANSPFGVRMTKQVMWLSLDAPSLRHAIAMEDRTQILTLRTADHPEALNAFVEKRAPAWAHNSDEMAGDV
jgi:enoyl-CoA hydratase